MNTNPKTKEETFEFLKQLLSEEHYCQKDSITPEATFENDLGLDSLEVVEVWMNVEKHLLISLNDEELKKCLTVGSLSDEIFKSLQKQSTISQS